LVTADNDGGVYITEAPSILSLGIVDNRIPAVSEQLPLSSVTAGYDYSLESL
jgi:hypothetical protein